MTMKIFCSTGQPLIYAHGLHLHLLRFPRTHSLRNLLEMLHEVTHVMAELFREYSMELGLLEDAYIMSRYVPRVFRKDEVERLMAVVKRVMIVLGLFPRAAAAAGAFIALNLWLTFSFCDCWWNRADAPQMFWFYFSAVLLNLAVAREKHHPRIIRRRQRV